MIKKPHIKTLEQFSPYLAALITGFLFLPFAYLGVDPHHDGIMLKPAIDVLSGQTLFKDTFTQYGALTTYLHVLGLMIFGKKLYALKLMTVFAYAVASAGLVMTWKRLIPFPLVVLSFGLGLLFAPFYAREWMMLPWSSAIALSFQAFCFYFLVKGFQDEWQKKWPMAFACAGAFAAATFWCRFPVGFLLSVGCVMAVALPIFFRGRFKPFLFLSLGMAVVHLGFLLWLGLSHSVGDWFFQTIVWPVQWSSERVLSVRHVLHNLFLYEAATFMQSHQKFYRVFSLTVFLVLMLIPFGVKKGRWIFPFLIGMGFVYWVEPQFFKTVEAWGVFIPFSILVWGGRDFFRALKNPGTFRDPAFSVGLAVSIVSVASWAQYYPVDCPRHVYWGMLPTIGIFFYHWLKIYPKAQVRNICLGICFIAAPLAVHKASQARDFLNQARLPFENSILAGMKGDPETVEILDTVHQAFQEVLEHSPDRPLLIEGPDALYGTWVKNLKHWSPITVTWQGLGERIDHKKVHFIESEQPLIYIQYDNPVLVQEYVTKWGYRPKRLSTSNGVFLGTLLSR